MQRNDKIPLYRQFLEKALKLKLHFDDPFNGPFPLSYFSSISLEIYEFSRKIEDICINNDWDDDELNDIANQISRFSFFC